MIVLTIRTDKPEAEIGLYDDDKQLAYEIWQAHRQLAETLHLKIRDLLARQGWSIGDIQALAVYQGPGSFTGLRIGLSVANALAYALELPIIGQTDRDGWIQAAIAKLQAGENSTQVLPEYGAEAHITLPKH